MRPLLAVTGLAAEAAVATRAGLLAICAGGAPERTAAALDAALGAAGAGGLAGLVSFGIAGGLAPGLAPGTIVIADTVVAPDRLYPTDPAWQRRLGESGIGIVGAVYGAARIVGSAASKAALRAQSRALAVDLESAVVARAALRAGLPLAVLRAIADPAERDLPPVAFIPLGADGRPDLRRILGALLRAPQQLPGLIRVAQDSRSALRALSRAASALAPVS